MDIANDLEQYGMDLDYEYEEDMTYADSQSYEEMYEQYNNMDYLEKMDFRGITELCVVPTLTETIQSYVVVLSLCFFIQLLCKSRLTGIKSQHIICGMLGIMLLCFHFQNDYQSAPNVSIRETMIIHSIILPLMSYLALRKLSKTRHHMLMLSSTFLSYLTICEFVIDPLSWSRIRSVQMIMVMKLISLVSDFQNRRFSEFPSYSQFFGYIFCVANILYGPWINFRVYLSILSPKTWTLSYFFKIFKCVLLSLLFFTLSTCYLDWFIPDSLNINVYFIYKTALSFRTSHYFVSFMSESFVMAMGLSSEDEFLISKPRQIEYPHSLVEVVIYWNIPMHKWLKMYVFKPLCNYNNSVAIFGTYFISSLLHGLNYQLSGVLLSLAIYTFIEYILRQKLARKFNACIQSKLCQVNCKEHRYTRRMLAVMFVNLIFTVLDLYHLAYLGYLIDRSGENLSFRQSFQKWHDLSYNGHLLVIATLILYFIF